MYIVGRLKVCFWRYIKGMLKMYEMVFQRYIKNIFMDSKDHIYIYYMVIFDILLSILKYILCICFHFPPISVYWMFLASNQKTNVYTVAMGICWPGGWVCCCVRGVVGGWAYIYICIYIYARHASRHLKKKSLNDGDMHFMIRKKQSFMVRRYAFHD